MGLLRSLVALPIAGPMNGALWLAGKIHETAESELTDPAAIRKALVDLERQLEAGDIDEDAFDKAENILLARLMYGEAER